jgi:FkbM family methyltransferase
LNTTCTIYRTEALPEPPFAENFKGYSLLEDLALSLTVGKRWKLANVRTARVFHDSQPGPHKAAIQDLVRMGLVNRYYVMTEILDRRGISDHVKFALLQLFAVLSVARTPRVLISTVKGQFTGVAEIVRRGKSESIEEVQGMKFKREMQRTLVDLTRLVLRFAPAWLSEKIYYRIVRPFRILESRQTKLRYAPNASICLTMGDTMHQTIAALGFYERDLSRRVAAIGRNGGLFVDVGANIGYHTLIWLAANPRNRAICFEPVAANIGMLKENLRLNDLSGQAEVFQCACGARHGEADFGNFWGPMETGCGGFVNRSESQTDSRVDVVRLDQTICASVNRIEFLKIDAEGADTWVLYGAANLLKEAKIQFISFEQNYWRMEALGIDKKETQEYLTELQYDVRRLGRRNAGVEQYIATPSKQRMN